MSFLKKFFPSFSIPKVKAQEDAGEEELVDQKTALKEKCAEDNHCANLNEILQTCNDRVSSRSQTAEICDEELFNYLHCLDHCISKKNLFSLLK